MIFTETTYPVSLFCLVLVQHVQEKNVCLLEKINYIVVNQVVLEKRSLNDVA